MVSPKHYRSSMLTSMGYRSVIASCHPRIVLYAGYETSANVRRDSSTRYCTCC